MIILSLREYSKIPFWVPNNVTKFVNNNNSGSSFYSKPSRIFFIKWQSTKHLALLYFKKKEIIHLNLKFENLQDNGENCPVEEKIDGTTQFVAYKCSCRENSTS